ncbi:hypothetical protein HJFPF1_05723 [Paramyrothecium foliicola]|nr:hypothetical protein HJFPF1_05723 [Paramyrothecium foliicola]
MRFSNFLTAALFVVSASAVGPIPRFRRPADTIELPPRQGQTGRDPIPRPLLPAPGPPQQPPPVPFQRLQNIQVFPQVFENRRGIVRYDNIPAERLTAPVNIDMVDAQIRTRLANNVNLSLFARQRAFFIVIMSNITTSPDSTYILQFVDEQNKVYFQSSSTFSVGDNQVITLDQTNSPEEAVLPLDSADGRALPSNATQSSTPRPTPTSSNGPAPPSDTSDNDPNPTGGAVATTYSSVLLKSIIMGGMAMILAHIMP